MKSKVVLWLNFVLATIALVSQLFYLVFEVLAPIALIWEIISLTLIIDVYGSSKRVKMVSRILLLVITSVLLITICLIIVEIADIESMLTGLVLSISMLLFITISIIYIRSHNLIATVMPFSLLLSIVGIVLRQFHVPGAGPLFFVFWIIPSTLLFFILYKKIDNYDTRTNRFLNFFNRMIVCALILSILGTLFKNMHWPGAGVILYLSIPLFIISVLSIVFLLPSSNFVEWTKEHKKIFYRAILIPLIYIGILNSLNLVYPQTFKWVFYGNVPDLNYDPQELVFQKYEIPLKEGME